MRTAEHDSQVALFRCIDLHSSAYPELALIFAIPMGGARTLRAGAYMKSEGARAGVPDLFVAVPRPPFAGLFIEMKVAPNKPLAAQLDWIMRLRAVGYKVLVCYSWFAAWTAICEYLGIEQMIQGEMAT